MNCHLRYFAVFKFTNYIFLDDELKLLIRTTAKFSSLTAEVVCIADKNDIKTNVPITIQLVRFDFDAICIFLHSTAINSEFSIISAIQNSYPPFRSCRIITKHLHHNYSKIHPRYANFFFFIINRHEGYNAYVK